MESRIQNCLTFPYMGRKIDNARYVISCIEARLSFSVISCIVPLALRHHLCTIMAPFKHCESKILSKINAPFKREERGIGDNTFRTKPYSMHDLKRLAKLRCLIPCMQSAVCSPRFTMTNFISLCPKLSIESDLSHTSCRKLSSLKSSFILIF